MSRSFCPECFEKQQRIDRLEEENQRLKQQLGYRQRQAEQGFFGSATPSAKVPLKPNTSADQRSKRGGAVAGHPGHGRPALDQTNADRIEAVEVESHCLQYGAPLEDKGWRNRTVFDSRPQRTERILYRLQKKFCPGCHRYVEARAPGVLPKALIGNQRLAQIVFWHYQHGIPLAVSPNKPKSAWEPSIKRCIVWPGCSGQFCLF